MVLYENKNMKLLVGKVAGENNVFEKDGKKTCAVKIQDRNEETVTVYFHNKPESSAKGDQLADRAIAAIKPNGFLTVLVLLEDGKTQATGLDFKYRGLWQFKKKDEEGNERPVNVIAGTACNPRKVKDGMFSVDVPVDVWNSEKRESETVWHSITFLDTDKGKSAEIAEKLFHEDKTLCAIRCGVIKEKEYNGKVYHNLWGYRAEVCVNN